MQKLVKKTTFRAILNRMFRIPKKVEAVKLENGIVCASEKFKNKEIVQVYGDFQSIFLKPL